MPCSISQGEIDSYEMEKNEKLFGERMTDSAVLEEVACSACRTLERQGRLTKAPKLVQQWWKIHKQKDAEKASRRKK